MQLPNPGSKLEALIIHTYWKTCIKFTFLGELNEFTLTAYSTYADVVVPSTFYFLLYNTLMDIDRAWQHFVSNFLLK